MVLGAGKVRGNPAEACASYEDPEMRGLQKLAAAVLYRVLVDVGGSSQDEAFSARRLIADATGWCPWWCEAVGVDYRRFVLMAQRRNIRQKIDELHQAGRHRPLMRVPEEECA